MTAYSVAQGLIAGLHNKTATIGIIGLGYVGLPLMLRYAEAGYVVLGFDIDPAKVEALAQGRSYFAHIPSSRVVAVMSERFQATTDFSRAVEADDLIICVPTPLNPYREPDLSYVVNTTKALLPGLRQGQVVDTRGVYREEAEHIVRA